jgi:hypothetical protein
MEWGGAWIKEQYLKLESIVSTSARTDISHPLSYGLGFTRYLVRMERFFRRCSARRVARLRSIAADMG